MKAQRKNQIRTVRNIIVAWTVIGVIVSFYDHFLLHSNISSGHKEDYSFINTLGFNVFAGFLGGVLGGLFLTTLNLKIRFKPFSYGQIWGAIGFLILFTFVSLITAVIPIYGLIGFDLSQPEVLALLKTQIFTSLHLKNLILWSLVAQLTQFYLQLQQKFGPGNLWKIFWGKYHTPKMESRIFMFLDLKSSTQIAENLGEAKYHQFLQDVFSDITEPINENNAEIYKYVGDEVIITWRLDHIRNKANCINIFFNIKEEFDNKKNVYLQKYNTIPKFKAGAHIGNAMVGEVGIIKRDITYSGDLLNTTARIQGRCNDFNSMFLISAQLKAYLSDTAQNWTFDSKGHITLRGKGVKMELFTVSN